MRTLNALFEYQLHYILSIESQLIEGLSIMASTTTDRMLNEVLEIQLEKTKENKKQLSVLANSFQGDDEVTCMVMNAYLQEVQQLIKMASEEEVLNAGLRTEIQKIVHFKISVYSAALYYANILDYVKMSAILTDLLDKEKQDLLTLSSLDKNHTD